ncbi:GDSL-type esterase/lipase family protein [Flavobacterium sp. 25HG05S-40]|uniref:GDSL-type esterase/lipase family protein n=1 Tax=Flavobacterium sp. 25HG05S-40 TaxID=3458682 RepID=UPI0040439FAD
MKSNPWLNCVLLIAITTFSNCQNKTNTTQAANFIFKGRVEKISESSAHLISPASSVTFTFKGTEAHYILKSTDTWEHHNYFCLEVDGQYKGRFRVEKGSAQKFSIQTTENKDHQVTIYKATEAASGTLFFDGTSIVTIVPTTIASKKKIEFIGDSITCGAQSDSSVMPCNQGEYFDQHNAYMAYGPILSRALNVDCMLSSVSGIGMYRNWNDENILEPIMPQVYENLYLNNNASMSFDASYQPDIVSICLGTNDMSDGDGKVPRLSFNKEKYTNNYINFVINLFKRYPNTQIVLLNSPMVSGERNKVLVDCLKKVIQTFKNDKTHKPIVMFEYDAMHANGCTGHPNIEDHTIMASQLKPFFTKLLDEK